MLHNVGLGARKPSREFPFDLMKRSEVTRMRLAPRMCRCVRLEMTTYRTHVSAEMNQAPLLIAVL